MFITGPRLTCLFAVLLLLVTARSAFAQATIHVPADRPTIQAGIDAAHNGDIVLVAPGTYSENIDFEGKAITVTSGAKTYEGASSTIIQASKEGPAVTFSSGETSASVLNGFTITHAHPVTGPLLGDGVAMGNASATITNNIITENTSCAISAVGASSFVIQGNHVIGLAPNSADPCGIPNIAHQHFLGHAPIVVTDSGDAAIASNIIEDAELGDTSVLVGYGSSLLFENNTVKNSTAAHSILDIININDIRIIQNAIYANSSGQHVVEVISDIAAALIAPFPMKLVFVNNTLANYVPAAPGQVQLFIAAPLVAGYIANNLLIDPSNQGQSLLCAPPIGSATLIRYNDIDPAVIPAPNTSCTSASQFVANLSNDPIFVDAAVDDYHVLESSPVVYAGDINAPDLPAADLDGRNRTVCGTIDMGVYQHHPHPAIALTASANPSQGGSNATFTAQLTGNCNVPTGMITFFDGATPIGTGTLNSSASASLTTAFLVVGQHTITAHYPGDFNFEDSTSNAITEVITGPPTTTVLTTVTPNPALAFQTISLAATVSSAYTVPAGTITFFAGATALATVPVAPNGYASSVVSTLGAGTYAITAVYNGSTEYAASTSNAVNLVVLPAPSAVILVAGPNPAYEGQTVTFQAGAAGTRIPSPMATGTIRFFDGATLLGSVPLSNSLARLTTDTLAVGSHTITGVYSGDANLAPSTSPAVIEVVLASSFSISLTPTRIAFVAGQPQQVPITLTSIGNYTGTLQLSTGALPLYASASFSPASVALTAGGTSSSVMTLLTAAPLVRAGAEDRPSGLPIALATLAGLPLLLLRRALRLPNLLTVLLACAAFASLAGCGSVRFAANSVPPGTYVIPITATDIRSGTSHAASLTLEVVR